MNGQMKRNVQVLLFTLLSFNAVPYILGFYPTNHHHTFRQQYPSLLIISSTRVKRAETSSCNIYKEDLLTEGPPISSKPDYSQIHSPLGALVDNFFLYIFRVQFAKNLGVDSRFPRSDFRGIIELVNALNSRYSDKETIQQLSMDIIKSIFPPWFCKFYVIFFARPFPTLSAKFLAFMVGIFGTWLMGECEVNSYEVVDPSIQRHSQNLENPILPELAENQGVLVKRCRILEESKCISVCMNSCKIPTQNFFQTYMGTNLTMTPNYETGECQFAFGKCPSMEEEQQIMNTPCYSICPSGGKIRKLHDKC